MERGRDVALNVPCLLGSKTTDVIASANGRGVYSSAAELNSRRAVYLSPYRVGRVGAQHTHGFCYMDDSRASCCPRCAARAQCESLIENNDRMTASCVADSGGTPSSCALAVATHRFEIRRDFTLEVLRACEDCLPVDSKPDFPVDLAGVSLIPSIPYSHLWWSTVNGSVCPRKTEEVCFRL